jgi:AcrR family transcriptional regulator
MSVSTKKKTRLEDARARMYHDLLFDAAEAIFGAHGFAGATMQEIAAEAGVSLKTLYATYPSKQDLHSEVMRVRAASFVEHVRAAMLESEEPLEQIRRGVAAYVEFLLEHDEWLSIHLRSRVAWSMRPEDEDALAAWKEGLDDYARIIQVGMERSVFLEGDAAELSVLTQSIMQVQMARAVEKGTTSLEPIVESILLYVWRLLGVRQPRRGSSPRRR